MSTLTAVRDNLALAQQRQNKIHMLLHKYALPTVKITENKQSRGMQLCVSDFADRARLAKRLIAQQSSNFKLMLRSEVWSLQCGSWLEDSSWQ